MKKHELTIDVWLALVLTLAPFGYENLDLPHSKAVGYGSWALCGILSVRIVWILAARWIEAARTLKITFKEAPEFTWWRRWVIRRDITKMHDYFESLEIEAPDPIPPFTITDDSVGTFTPPHVYRGELMVPRTDIKNRKKVTYIYAAYVIQKAVPDPSKSFDFGDPTFALRIFQSGFFFVNLKSYFEMSYWDTLENCPPHALILWKIRASLGRKFTDKLIGCVLRILTDSPQEILDPDVNVSLARALKIADGLLEANQQSWPKIQDILDHNIARVEFRNELSPDAA
jgi:hypothetical protein